jgi:hypothetical protein
MHLSATEAYLIHLREHDSCPSAALPVLCVAVDEHAVFSTGQLSYVYSDYSALRQTPEGCGKVP